MAVFIITVRRDTFSRMFSSKSSILEKYSTNSTGAGMDFKYNILFGFGHHRLWLRQKYALIACDIDMIK